MKQLIIVIASLLSCVFCISQAFAQYNCPDGTLPVVNMQTGASYCLATVSTPEPNRSVVNNTFHINNTYNNASNEQDKVQKYEEALSIKNAMRSSGFELNVGIGYAMVASFDMRLTGGYHFGIDSLDGLSFGLYGEFSGQLGFPMSVAFDVVPMMHVHGESFRVSFGFGLGVFYISNSDELSGNTLFEMRPEIRFDWFLSEHILIGVEASVPLLLLDKSYKSVEPWFMFDIYFGYRF